jgi:hypothetical protein
MDGESTMPMKPRASLISGKNMKVSSEGEKWKEEAS